MSNLKFEFTNGDYFVPYKNDFVRKQLVDKVARGDEVSVVLDRAEIASEDGSVTFTYLTPNVPRSWVISSEQLIVIQTHMNEEKKVVVHLGDSVEITAV